MLLCCFVLFLFFFFFRFLVYVNVKLVRHHGTFDASGVPSTLFGVKVLIYFCDLRALLLFGVSLLVMLRVNPPM